MQMKDGYTDGHHGEWIMPPAQLEERAKLYWDAGYQFHIHVNGDLGLDTVLDVLERRMREHPRADHRTVIVHFANSTEEQIKRAARLGAIVCANPYYTTGFADKYGQVGLGTQARRRHGAGGFGAEEPHLALVSLGPADGAERSALSRLGGRESPHAIWPRGWRGASAFPSTRRCEPSRSRPPIPGARRIRSAASRPARSPISLSWKRTRTKSRASELKDVPVWGTVFEGRVFPVPEGVKRAERAAVPAPQVAAQRPQPASISFRKYAIAPRNEACDMVGLAHEAARAYEENVASTK